MKIKSLHLENFRGLIDERIDFDSSMTVLAGNNGGGKSSVLEAVSIVLSWLPVGLADSSVKPLKIKPRDISYGKSFSRITAVLSERGMRDISVSLTKCADSPHDVFDVDGARKYAEDMRVLLDSPRGEKIDIPVFAHYGTNRTSSGCPSPLPCNAADRTSVYSRAFCSGTDFSKFSKWFVSAIINREREIAAVAGLPLRRANRARDEINVKYSAVYAVKKALADFSETFRGITVRDGELFIDAKHIFASMLSDGEKTVIALIADIAMRMSVANPRRKNPLGTSAIVLVDELDLHLHPDWQVAIASRLPQIFSGAQFIISSHSPSIMSVSRNLYRLSSDGGDARFERVDAPFGRSPADLLNSVLHAGREPSTAAKFSQMYHALDSGDIKTARKIIDELNVEIPDDPEVLKAEYLARSLDPEK